MLLVISMTMIATYGKGHTYSTNRRATGDYEKAFRLDGELSPAIRGRGRRIMGEDVTDQSLLDLSGLGMGEIVDESVLSRALNRILKSSADGPNNSFSASI
jgi:hypothetical protein